MKSKIFDFLLGWDFISAFIAVVLTCIFVPEYMSMKFVLSFYNVGISVLSIVFSVFFAALAIIISASDNEFIDFMEEDGSFTRLVWTLKFTLKALFISLVYSIVLYITTNYYIEGIEVKSNERWLQHSILFIMFEALFIYSMVSTVMGVNNSIIFTQFRIRFLKQKKLKDKNEAPK